MIIAAAKMSFKRLSMFTLLSLCVNGIVARKLSPAFTVPLGNPFYVLEGPFAHAHGSIGADPFAAGACLAERLKRAWPWAKPST
jgi:hypothetical protein